MANPPDDVDARDLWRKLQETPCPSEVIDFPRKGGDGKPVAQVRVQVLRMAQHDDARLKAHERLKKKGLKLDDVKKSPLIEETLGDAVARELLAMACLRVKPIAGSDPEKPTYPRVFTSGEDLETACTADEVAALFNAYLLVQNRYGPHEGNLSKEELDAWVNRLSEGAASYPLAVFSYQSLAELCLLLSERLSKVCQTLHSQWSSLPDSLASDLTPLVSGITSAGSQPDETTSDDDGPDIPADEPITTEQAMELARRLGHQR